jgi:SAM-dependent methyltransferase
MLRSIVGHLVRAVFQPARRDRPVQVVQSFAGLPRTFDLLSWWLQTCDLRRLRGVGRSYAVDDAHHRSVQDYNAGVTKSKVISTTRRAEHLYRLLAYRRPHIAQDRLLIVGPRNRAELLLAWVHGFSWNNIAAIDLYSVNPKIHVMNMEAMTWPGESFDAVTMANTLSYAADTDRAIGEVARILRPGGHFAFTATYDPGGERWKEDEVAAAQISGMLHDAGFEVEAHVGIDKINSEGRRQTSHDFLARKIPTGEARLDPFRL